MQADELTALPYKQAGQGGCRQMSSQHCPVHNVHAGAAASIQPASQLHSPSLPTCAPSPRSIPVSTSHICVFAAVAVGLFEGRKGVNWWMVLQVGGLRVECSGLLAVAGLALLAKLLPQAQHAAPLLRPCTQPCHPTRPCRSPRQTHTCRPLPPWSSPWAAPWAAPPAWWPLVSPACIPRAAIKQQGSSCLP